MGRLRLNILKACLLKLSLWITAEIRHRGRIVSIIFTLGDPQHDLPIAVTSGRAPFQGFTILEA